MVSLAVFYARKRGTGFFRKPWRRLLEDFPSSKAAATATMIADTAKKTADATVKEEKQRKMDEVVSRVLEQVPRTVQLHRSSPPPPPASAPTPAFTPTKATPISSSATKDISDVKSTDKNNTSTPSLESSPSVRTPASPPAISDTPDSSLLNDFSSLETVYKSSSTTSGEMKTTRNAIINGDHPDDASAQLLQSTSDNTTNIAATQQPVTETGVKNADSSTTKASNNVAAAAGPTDWFKPWGDALQEHLKKMAVLPDTAKDNNNNNTRIEKQGGDVLASSLALPSTPEERRYLLTKGSSLLATIFLVQTYFGTGRFSFFWEDTLYALAGLGYPLTMAMHRSLCVLLGHLTWVGFGSAILALVPRPRFFGKGNKWVQRNAVVDDDNNNDALTDKDDTMAAATSQRHRRKNNWIWWVIGGYSISAWFFNIADFVNLYTLPQQVLEDSILQEGVVTQLINPENNDFLASLVGYIAPCLSAPWWEEILYRGFFFPALTLFMPVWASVLVSGIIFSAHHLSLTAALPLAVLGWTWCGLYMASDNIWTTIVVHALWNSRVFLSSWLGV
jgi:membrane protease YdiL (CAAX protease family)